MLHEISKRLLMSLAITISFSTTIPATDGSEAKIATRNLSTPAYRGPVDVAVNEQAGWAATANSLSNSVSLIDLKSKFVVDEIPCEGQPAAIARVNNKTLLVSCRDSGYITRFEVNNLKLTQTARIFVGFEPLGLAVTLDSSGKTNTAPRAYVALSANDSIAEIDLDRNELIRTLPVGKMPRYLDVTPDAKRLAVGLGGESNIAVVDLESGEVAFKQGISGGINIGHLKLNQDGTSVYFPWMVYRTNPITVSNIRRGWVLASRVARVRIDRSEYREAISLDVPGEAVADPHGLAITPNEKRMAVTSSGTHELLVYRLNDLPFIGTGGPGDLIDRRLMNDKDLFYRIELGGRPMGMVASQDNRHVYVANDTSDSLQIVDIESQSVSDNVELGTRPTDPQQALAHRGREIFHDARRSLDQWYSCNSCHLDGGSNAKAMDTWNDGTELTSKTVLPLYSVTETGPWTWHGWQEDLNASIQNSFISTMQGPKGSADDIAAVEAYLETLSLPANPFLSPDGSLSKPALRGKEVFDSTQAGCTNCHSGPHFTDGLVHDVGLGSDRDAYQGYNTPSLRGLYRKPRYLHDGRAKTLERVLEKYHRPEDVSGGEPLTETQLSDLIEYLKSL